MFNCSQSTITINGKTFKNTSATLEWLIKQLGLAEDSIECIKDTTAFKRDVSKITSVVPTYSELVAQLQEDGVEDPETYLAQTFGITAETDFNTYASELSTAIGWGTNISGKGCVSLGSNNIISDGVLSNSVGALNIIKGTKTTAIGYYTNTEANNAINVGVGGLSGKTSEDNTWYNKYWQTLYNVGAIESPTSPLSIGVVKAPVSGQFGNNHIDNDAEEQYRYTYGIGYGNYSKGTANLIAGHQNIGIGQDVGILGTRNYINNVIGAYVLGNTNEAGSTEQIHGVVQIGEGHKASADSTFAIGINHNLQHENVYALGRGCVSGGSYQTLLGNFPSALSNTLFAVGDGDGTTHHNLIVAYKNVNTGRATHMCINTRLLTEGNVESDKKVIAKQAPTQDNDCIRWQEYKALESRIAALEARV